ncbi:MAG: hypothetical protein NTW19_15125 [Planctomycetota bacterium]|nr:hypothetical protein [Planctomycetota bacterium]
MNKQATAYRRVQTDQPFEEVMKATEEALRRVGGRVDRVGHTIKIQNGDAGNLGFMATADAYAVVKPEANSTYQITCDITVRPGTLFWVCAIGGLFCLWPLWVVNLLYFVNDPAPAYQRALDQVVFFPPVAPPAVPPV